MFPVSILINFDDQRLKDGSFDCKTIKKTKEKESDFLIYDIS